MTEAIFPLFGLNGTNGFVLNGIDSGDYSGRSVSSAGDVNGDGIDDLIIGAYFADPNGNSYAGESYVVFGVRANTAPVANDDTANTTEDTTVTGNVLDGSNGGEDTDLDGDTLTVTGNTNPTNGSVVVDANGDFTYTPNPNFNGSDSFTYTISDGNSGSDTATVNITVGAVNDAPVANDDTANTIEDTTVTGNVLDGSNGGEDTDLDGDTLTVTGNTNPTNGSVVVDANGDFTYTPNPNFNGSDSFTYTISDGNGGSDTATVNITVGAVNDAPEIITPNTVDVPENTTDVIDINTTDDNNREGAGLSYRLTAGEDRHRFEINLRTGELSNLFYM